MVKLRLKADIGARVRSFFVMVRYFFLMAGLFVLGGAFAGAAAAQDKTIILVRHAEKGIDTEQNGDPPLSEAGSERAKRFAKRIAGLRPGAFYASEYKRTKETIDPIARKRGKAVETYDTRGLRDLVNNVMASKIKRIVIAGHSNTIPMIANELINKKLFRDMDESEFAVIWIIRIRDGQFKSAKLLPY